MKFLLAGDWHSELHERTLSQALRALGHQVEPFPWHGYFKARGGLGIVGAGWRRAQNKYLTGPLIRRLNQDLLDRIAAQQPDVVFVYRGTHILPQTLELARRRHPEVLLAGYNNDDPFSPHYPAWLWRHFLSGLPLYDIVFAYRHRNLDDFRRAGARRVALLRAWYVPERNHPVSLSAAEAAEYASDLVFVGHYEDDGRVSCLEELVRHGWRLRLFGPGYDWDPVLRRSPRLRHLLPVRLVWGEDYNKALCGARIALCFLSKLNRDTYTRRCFEIPATGTMMLAEYSDDLAGLYKEDEEAAFFRTPAELAEKAARYLSDDALRARVAAAGRKRVEADGHDVLSRARDMVEHLREIRKERDAIPA